MTPYDRRGLGEVVAWACACVMSGVVLMVAIVKHDPAVPYLAAPFIGTITALVSRGTKGAMDRDALRERDRT